MSLIIEDEERVWWPVTFERPDDSGSGRKIKATSKFLWELADTALLNDASMDEQERAELLRLELIGKIHDWDVQGPDKTKLECTPDNIELIMRRPWIAVKLMEAWLECSMGGAAKKKSGKVRS